VNATNHKGSTPLHFACYSDCPAAKQLVQSLLRHDANIESRDARGNTPLLVCCLSGRDDIIDLLLEQGANPNVKNSDGETANSIAIFHNHLKIADKFDEYKSKK